MSLATLSRKNDKPPCKPNRKVSVPKSKMKPIVDLAPMTPNSKENIKKTEHSFNGDPAWGTSSAALMMDGRQFADGECLFRHINGESFAALSAYERKEDFIPSVPQRAQSPAMVGPKITDS
jgi:hypothetical protein